MPEDLYAYYKKFFELYRLFSAVLSFFYSTCWISIFRSLFSSRILILYLVSTLPGEASFLSLAEFILEAFSLDVLDLEVEMGII